MMHWRAGLLIPLIVLFGDGALQMCSTAAAQVGDGKEPEGYSLFGAPLLRMRLEAERERVLVDSLSAARERYEEDPEDPERLIWLGRRTAYLGHYREAIAIYATGIEKWPEDPRLYRHRGHRYISVRDFDRAIEDLERASQLIEGLPDAIEPDGAPNKFNIPRSTTHSNIWYHLGLAYYLTADLENALRCYLECMKFSRVNDDMLCATSDWLYMTYRRLGREVEAERVLDDIDANMEILENFSYHKRLLMYRGEKTAASLLEVEGDDALALATQGYGVANWYLYNGDVEKARALFERILASAWWPAFGYIAAEADLLRLRAAAETELDHH